MVERIVCIGFVEKIDDAVDDRVDVKDWLPVITQDVEAHVALQVDVWVVHLHRMEDYSRRRRKGV